MHWAGAYYTKTDNMKRQDPTLNETKTSNQCSPRFTYNLTNAGPTLSWAQIAKRVFELRGRDATDVTEVTTAEYFAGKTMAPRPTHSTLALGKVQATGFQPVDADLRLADYLAD